MKKGTIPSIGFFVLGGALLLGNPKELSASQPQVKTYHGISYLSGGIGLEEREALRTMAKEDNLKLSFALQNRDYLGGAKVLIKDDKGKKVLEAVSDGPLFFTKLPAGNYTVEATAMSKTLEQVARVSTKGQTRLYFTWKESNHEIASHSLARKVSRVSHRSQFVQG